MYARSKRLERGKCGKHYYFVLIALLCVSVPPVTDARPLQPLQLFRTIGEVALDLFGLGTGLFDLFTNANDNVGNSIKELSNKLDLLLNSVDDFNNKMVDLFEQQKLDIRLQDITSFERETSSRLRDLKQIASAGAKQDSFMRKFFDKYEDGTYEDDVQHFVDRMCKQSSGKTIFQLVADNQRCNQSYMSNFIEYVNDILSSGIAIETAYNAMKFNLTPNETNLHYWEKQLGLFDECVSQTMVKCKEKFGQYYLEDIRSNKSDVDELFGILHSRYPEKHFMVIEMKTTTLIEVTSTNDNLQVLSIQHSCDKMRCFLFADYKATCEHIPAVHMREHSGWSRDQIKWYAYKSELEDRLGWYFIPDGCSDAANREFIPLADDQKLTADGVTCGARRPVSLTIALQMSICLIALFYASK